MSNKTKSKTIKNIVDLIKNTIYMIKYSYGVLPWQTVLLFTIELLTGTIPLFSSKALGALVDNLISAVNTHQDMKNVLTNLF